MAIQQIISPEVAEPAPGMWSNCLKVDNTIYVAGLTARDRQQNVVGADEYQQSRLVFERIQHLVRAAGATMKDVVKLNIYVTDIARREMVWKARKEFFDGAFPVATLVEVSSLQPGVLVEIEAVAVLGHGGRP